MNELYLVADIAGQRIALAADWVDSVVHVSQLTEVPLAPPHLIGLAALRSRAITMIDSRTALGLEQRTRGKALVTIVINLDGHQYGLVVDRVDDVCSIPGSPAPVRTRLGAGWARVSLGMLDHEGASVLLVDPATLVSGEEMLAA